MNGRGVDPALLHAWLRGRSLARGLPAPVPEHGGFRVDTRSEAEVVRWVFPDATPGLAQLALTIREPRHLLKLCGTTDDLRAMLPDGWQIDPPNHFMQGGGAVDASVPAGYRIETERAGDVCRVRVVAPGGDLAASGYGAETPEAFVYDRIVTEPEHRRKGLGRAVMASLGAARRNAGGGQLLVATEEGRLLYETLGWWTISPYATASIRERDADDRR